MTFEQRMQAFFANASITALVGTRAFAVNAGQGVALPYVVWSRVASAPANSHDAVAQLEEHTVQVTAIAATHAQACQVRRAVRSVIEGNHADGPAVYAGSQDIFSDDKNAYAVSCDFSIWHAGDESV